MSLSNNPYSVISGSKKNQAKAVKAICSKGSKEQRPKSQIKHIVDDPLYKTKLCKYYSKGKCTASFRCKYAHGTQQLRPKPTLKPASQHENPCPKKQKTQMCKFGKNCTRGDDCWFAHDPSEIVTCPGLLSENYKTQMCRDMENGNCSRGDSCAFAHSQDELNHFRARGQKIAPLQTVASKAGLPPMQMPPMQMPAAETKEEVSQEEYTMNPEDFPPMADDNSDDDNTQYDNDVESAWSRPVDITDMVEC